MISTKIYITTPFNTHCNLYRSIVQQNSNTTFQAVDKMQAHQDITSRLASSVFSHTDLKMYHSATDGHMFFNNYISSFQTKNHGLLLYCVMSFLNGKQCYRDLFSMEYVMNSIYNLAFHHINFTLILCE